MCVLILFIGLIYNLNPGRVSRLAVISPSSTSLSLQSSSEPNAGESLSLFGDSTIRSLIGDGFKVVIAVLNFDTSKGVLSSWQNSSAIN